MSNILEVKQKYSDFYHCTSCNRLNKRTNKCSFCNCKPLNPVSDNDVVKYIMDIEETLLFSGLTEDQINKYIVVL